MSTYFDREWERRQDGPYRIGTVVAVSSAEGLDVTVNGGLVTGLQFLSSYLAPGAGDVVAVLIAPGRMFVLGKIGNSGDTLGPNLLPNPGFELGGALPSSWITAFGGVARVENEAVSHASSASLQFSMAGVGAAVGRNVVTDGAFAVEEGITYRLGGWWLGTSADTQISLRIHIATGPTAEDAQFGDPDGVYFLVASDTARAAWTEVTGLRTIPAGHFYARVFLSFLTAGAPTAAAVYVDDVSMREQI